MVLMKITLEGISLSNLIIEGEFNFTGVQSEVETSLGGTPIIWEQEYSGKPIDLVGGEKDDTWLSKKILLELQAFASVVETTYTLIYEGTSMTVRFRNEDYPAIKATSVVARSKKVMGEYYENVRIKLMVV
jgi:hypothetical protein